MELIYKKPYRLLQSQFMPNDSISPYAILDISADIAANHAYYLDMGYEHLISKNLLWMIVQTEYEMTNDIPLYGNIDVTTWPDEKGKIDFMRNIKFEYEGKTFIKVISRWVIVDKNTRKLYIPRDINYDGQIHKEDTIALERLKDFDVDGITPFIINPRFSDLDHNGHVNNVNYARYIMDAINEDMKIKKFNISFIKEVLLTDELKIYVKKEDCYMIKGMVNDDSCFLAKIERRI